MFPLPAVCTKDAGNSNYVTCSCEVSDVYFLLHGQILITLLLQIHVTY